MRASVDAAQAIVWLSVRIGYIKNSEHVLVKEGAIDAIQGGMARWVLCATLHEYGRTHASLHASCRLFVISLARHKLLGDPACIAAACC